ncbi:MAG: DUF1836 domain-containing protein [Oscillospiraceae bacterium]|nr:DUF1836 domain-containing protein [Oscillospiraceae bacterium]
MIKAMPGTTIELGIAEWDTADKMLEAMFLSGGLVLSQVARLSGLAPYDVQNWVRRGFVSPPHNKRYSRRQLSRIFIINMLKGSLQIDRVCSLLSYINGDLSDESDDSIDDTRLFIYLVRLCAAVELGEKADITAVLSDYHEPFPGARVRVARVLEIMVIAYQASSLRQKAENMILDIDINEGG